MFGKKYEIETVFDNKSGEFRSGDVATGSVTIRPLSEIEVNEVEINLVQEIDRKRVKKRNSNTVVAAQSTLWEQKKRVDVAQTAEPLLQETQT